MLRFDSKKSNSYLSGGYNFKESDDIGGLLF